ncbi:MAG: hypothetical protein ABIG39_07365 [Candidatus Micrarchaeota archaeon]
MSIQKLRNYPCSAGAVVDRNNHRKDFLRKTGVGNGAGRIGEWRRLLLSTLEYEGNYCRPVGGSIPKNQTMRLLEGMAMDDDSRERVCACLGLGNMRVNFPDLQEWADEILLVLGTDEEKEVRQHAILALNVTVSAGQYYLGKLKKMEEQEKSNP